MSIEDWLKKMNYTPNQKRQVRIMLKGNLLEAVMNGTFYSNDVPDDVTIDPPTEPSDQHPNFK
jgi:hypothetical protein